MGGKWIESLALALLLCGCGASPRQAEAPGEPEVLRQYQFELNPGVTIPVLRRDVFLQRFEDNPHVARTDDAVIALAHKVFVAPELLNLHAGDTCGEHWEGTVLGALSNPQLADSTRKKVDQLMAAPVPPFPEVYDTPHFRFYYTTTDADPKQNVTLADVKATAVVMERTWTDYVKHFTTPKHKTVGGQPRVQVRIYELGGTLYGSTSSYSNYIRLSSRRVAKFRCKRESTPVHELFHRVQYASGYVSGASEKYWAVEGTAAWSQKYLSGHIGDYLSRFGSAMAYPDRSLFKRKYDAITLWLHLGRWTGDERAGVSLLWKNYKALHKTHRYALAPSLDATLQTLIGRDVDHEWLIERWSLSSLTKDAANASHTQTYAEQDMVRRCDSKIYGPVPGIKWSKVVALKPGHTELVPGKVYPYGSDYLMVAVDPAVKSVDLHMEGDAGHGFAFTVEERDAANNITQLNRSGRHQKKLSLSLPVSASGPARLGLVITAMGLGGNWTVKVEGK